MCVAGACDCAPSIAHAMEGGEAYFARRAQSGEEEESTYDGFRRYGVPSACVAAEGLERAVVANVR